MRQLILAALAWSLFSHLGFSQKGNPLDLDELVERMDTLDKAGKIWLSALEQSAKDGHVEAQAELCKVFSLGFMFVNNKSMKVPTDYTKALELCRKSADQGHGGGQYWLGNMYYEGTGVPRNYSKASKWFRKAAMQGVWVAQYVLGHMYYEGKGVLQDFVHAYALWNLAAARGDISKTERGWAVSSRDNLREEMTLGQVAEAQKLAAKLQERIEAANLD